MDFTTFISNVYDEVANKNAQTLTQLRRITIRQLQELSQHPFLQMEGEASFQTVPGVSAYGVEHPGFPGDVFSIERLYYISGNQKVQIEGPKPMGELRFNWPSTVSSAQFPIFWGFWNKHLQVTPAPTGAITLYLDFTHDATRDEKTGTVIAETSTGESNPWFRRAELALRHAVLAEYFSQPRWADDAAAQRCLGMRNQHLDTLKTEFLRRKGAGGQAPFMLGEIGRETARPYLFLGGL